MKYIIEDKVGLFHVYQKTEGQKPKVLDFFTTRDAAERFIKYGAKPTPKKPKIIPLTAFEFQQTGTKIYKRLAGTDNPLTLVRGQDVVSVGGKSIRRTTLLRYINHNAPVPKRTYLDYEYHYHTATDEITARIKGSTYPYKPIPNKVVLRIGSKPIRRTSLLRYIASLS